MKIAITGKGGVGKTTLSALMAKYLSERGRDVIAVDADPDANLASALGVSAADIPEPISGMKEFIQERTGAKGGYGGYFKINPRVDDIPERFAHEMEHLRLLVLGGVASGGGGCICPEGALLKALVMHLVLGRGEVVILDMEAGIEHLGRATAQGVSAMIVVVDPGSRSIETARTIKRLAGEIGIKHVAAVVNRAPESFDPAAMASALPEVALLGTLPYDPEIMQADVDNRCPYTGSDTQVETIGGIVKALEELVAAE